MKKLWIALVLLVYLAMILTAPPGNAILHLENDELVAPPFANKVSITESGDDRIVESNGVPHHRIGLFPGPGNPNTLREQDYHFRIPLHPRDTGHDTSIENVRLFGVALDGVVFDPGTAAYWHFDSAWHVEAIVQGRRDLGIDLSNAHVQPNGAYHYHGLPTGLIQELGDDTKMKLIGWAADGYPIYNQLAYRDASDPSSPLVKLRSSYRLKEGNRPDGFSGPGGTCDGTYTADYEYAPGSGDLDENNGRSGVTPEFPQGTYYYVLTDSFPYIPRSFKGIPDPSFAAHGHLGGGPPGGPGGPGGPPGFQPPPPPPF